jgi:hypothetical protein
VFALQSLACVLLCGLLALSASTTQPAPVKLTTEQDQQRIMQLLNLTSIPPGADGRHPNLDESKANPYPSLPDPLKLNDGEKVTTSRAWWDLRRPEILELFQREIYGRTPKTTPAVTWELTSKTTDAVTVTKKLIGHVDNSSYPQISVNIQLTLVTPADVAGPVPVIMQFTSGFFLRRFAALTPPPGSIDWHKLVLAQHWGYATLDTSTIQADNGAGLTSGIIGLCNKGQPRVLDDWGALSAWAWGASRALDYFQTDPAVDARQVGLEGHSRWGKAALLAMALDQRFAIAYVSSSGQGGAKLLRRNFGELVENVASSGEYHWMAGNFLKYAGHWDDLPVDSHELIALCAPRPVLITGGANGDSWVDPHGMFMAAIAAGPVYRLLGAKDLGDADMPAVDVPLIDGDLAFELHNGGHTDVPSWPTFITFAGRYLHAPPADVHRPS